MRTEGPPRRRLPVPPARHRGSAWWPWRPPGPARPPGRPAPVRPPRPPWPSARRPACGPRRRCGRRRPGTARSARLPGPSRPAPSPWRRPDRRATGGHGRVLRAGTARSAGPVGTPRARRRRTPVAPRPGTPGRRSARSAPRPAPSGHRPTPRPVRRSPCVRRGSGAPVTAHDWSSGRLRRGRCRPTAARRGGTPGCAAGGRAGSRCRSRPGAGRRDRTRRRPTPPGCVAAPTGSGGHGLRCRVRPWCRPGPGRVHPR